ncbi:MAG: YggT family protein [SAR324 cluster bacterium]|nr:YggT family protein [SAR324 cluster bacterium]MCZ6749368.1 YggT family protein [SAR324 cluster bacterium]
MELALSFLSTLTYWALTIYEWIVIIAILLSWVNPDPRNPIVVFLNNMTIPFWNWLRAYLPSRIRLFAPYVSLLVIWFLKIFLPGTLQSMSDFFAERADAMSFGVQVLGYFFLGLGIVLQNFLFFLMMLLVVWFFLTLVSPAVNNPIVRTIYFLVDPFITPVQRRLPRMRVDVSPLIVAGIFFAISIFGVASLIAYASGLTAYGVLMPLPGETY